MGVKRRPKGERAVPEFINHETHETHEKERFLFSAPFVYFVYFVVRISDLGVRPSFGLRPSAFGLA
jgi:hypothetical protein